MNSISFLSSSSRLWQGRSLKILKSVIVKSFAESLTDFVEGAACNNLDTFSKNGSFLFGKKCHLYPLATHKDFLLAV